MSASALSLPRHAELPLLSRVLVSFALNIAAWDERRRTRAALSRLDGHLLRDIGLGADRAATECTKPFWRD